MVNKQIHQFVASLERERRVSRKERLDCIEEMMVSKMVRQVSTWDCLDCMMVIWNERTLELDTLKYLIQIRYTLKYLIQTRNTSKYLMKLTQENTSVTMVSNWDSIDHTLETPSISDYLDCTLAMYHYTC